MYVGLILAAIVAAGLSYVMIGLKRSGDADALGLETGAAAGDPVVVVRSGVDDDVTPIDAPQVSTPLLRRAARQEVARASRAAVHRRRIGLMVAAAAVFGVAAAAALVPGVPPQFGFATPVPLLVWVIVARVSVVVTHWRWRARLDSVDSGWDEETTVIDIGSEDNAPPRSEMSVELSVPLASIPSLLEPLPVAPATYVSRPVLPRSIHTIDLSAPAPASWEPRFPISADMPQDVLPFEGGDGGDESTTDLGYVI